MHALIQSLDSIFKKAPPLPVHVKEFIVKYAPYFVIVSLIIAAASVLQMLFVMLGFGAFLAYFLFAGSWTRIIIALALIVVVAILELKALPGLHKKTEESWNLIFYAELVYLLSMLFSLNILGLIVSAIVGFYILFQVRSYYTGATPGSAPTSSAPKA